MGAGAVVAGGRLEEGLVKCAEVKPTTEILAVQSEPSPSVCAAFGDAAGSVRAVANDVTQHLGRHTTELVARFVEISLNDPDKTVRQLAVDALIGLKAALPSFDSCSTEVGLANAREMWNRGDGFISKGGDILVETMTIKEAKQKALCLTDCKGFCFRGAMTEKPVEIIFKNKFDRTVGKNPWISYRINETARETVDMTMAQMLASIEKSSKEAERLGEKWQETLLAERKAAEAAIFAKAEAERSGRGAAAVLESPAKCVCIRVALLDGTIVLGPEVFPAPPFVGDLKRRISSEGAVAGCRGFRVLQGTRVCSDADKIEAVSDGDVVELNLVLQASTKFAPKDVDWHTNPICVKIVGDAVYRAVQSDVVNNDKGTFVALATEWRSESVKAYPSSSIDPTTELIPATDGKESCAGSVTLSHSSEFWAVEHLEVSSPNGPNKVVLWRLLNTFGFSVGWIRANQYGKVNCLGDHLQVVEDAPVPEAVMKAAARWKETWGDILRSVPPELSLSALRGIESIRFGLRVLALDPKRELEETAVFWEQLRKSYPAIEHFEDASIKEISNAFSAAGLIVHKAIPGKREPFQCRSEYISAARVAYAHLDSRPNP